MHTGTTAIPQSIGNWRDIGGQRTTDGRTVVHGLLYRCAHLGKATAEDLELLRQLGIRVVVDLRADLEAEDEGIGVPEGAERLAFGLPASEAYLMTRDYVARGDYEGLLASLAAGGEVETVVVRHMAEFYVEMTADAQGVFAGTLRHLADSANSPAIVHCSAGKDRTGWTVALLLLALGVPVEDVMAEYLLSNAAAAQAVPDPRLAEQYAALIGVLPEYLAGALTHVQAHYGGIDTYLRDTLAIDDATRDALRTRFLTAG